MRIILGVFNTIIDNIQSNSHLVFNVILNVPILEKIHVNIVGLRHNFSGSIQGPFLYVDVNCSFYHRFIPFQLVVVEDLAVRVIGVYVTAFHLLTHYVLLACVVQPARNSLRKFLSLFLLRFIGQFYQFVKIMNLKCIQYFCTIFQSLE